MAVISVPSVCSLKPPVPISITSCSRVSGYAPYPDYPLPEEAKNLVMLLRLNIDGSNVMFSDVFQGSPFIAGNNISLSLVNADMDGIKAAFDKLKVGCTVVMELQETFWSKLYGGLTDEFGITWQFS